MSKGIITQAGQCNCKTILLCQKLTLLTPITNRDAGVGFPSFSGGCPFFALDFLDKREKGLLLITVASFGRHDGRYNGAELWFVCASFTAEATILIQRTLALERR